MEDNIKTNENLENIPENIIEIKNLSKIFNDSKEEVVALKDINLNIKRGEIFGIIGLSGAGKSTLVRMMNFLTTPTDGKVLFEGRSLGELNDKELRDVRKQIGMIFQNFNLLMQTNVLRNVTFPLELDNVGSDERVKRARELLSLVDLLDKEKAYPAKLSGGQKQRVAIARALATNPKVLLCDEATSALDPKTTTQILDLLKKINKELNVTIVIITHQMSVIEKVCDEVAIIDQSQIMECGPVKEIFTHPKSNIGKKLIFGNTEEHTDEDFNFDAKGKNVIRLAFDGAVADEPIISNMVLESNGHVNILFANTKMIEGKVMGQMVLELPEDEEKAHMMKKYLRSKNITFWEVN